VDNDYSINPLDYGLAAGEDVINSLTPFAGVCGEKRKRASMLQLDMD